MAKSVMVRRIVNENGEIFVDVTYGTPPLGAQPNLQFSYANEEILKERIAAIEDRLGDEGLTLLHLAITYLKQDGTLANVNQVYNKQLNLDVFAANPLRMT